MKMIRKFITALVAVALLALGLGTASAQSNMPDATVLYTGLYAPFNTSLTWVISATAVLVLIGWILKAVRRR